MLLHLSGVFDLVSHLFTCSKKSVVWLERGNETRVLSDQVAGVHGSLTFKYLLTNVTFRSQKPLLKVFVASCFICHQMFILLVHNAQAFNLVWLV